MRILYAISILLGSSLLFIVEPLVSKLILPRFGGAPAVWNGSMLFFQVALLAGYGYAHLMRKVDQRAQTVIHAVLLFAGFLFLPTKLPEHAGEGTTPLLDLLGSLVWMIGLPFIAVSAGASLLQAWYAKSGAKDSGDPFWLYAASNAGSLLGLGLYPLYFESRFTLQEQTQLWRFLYLGLAILLVVCGFAVAARKQSSVVEASEVAPDEVRSNKNDIFKWVLLAAIPSSLLLGVTNYLTTNIAPIPMLWVVPLALYLLTFIFAFTNKKTLSAKFLGRALPLFATPLVLAIILESTEPMGWLGLLHLTVFFIAAWMCHRKLYEDRPSASQLTAFYWWVSVGGAVGGIFNVLLAPVLFSSTYEYPVALVLACMVRPPIKEGKFDRTDALIIVAVGMLMTLIAMAVRIANLEPSPLRTFILLGPTLGLAFFGVDRPIRFGLSLGAIFWVCFALSVSSDGSVKLTERSFFGVHRVISSQQTRFMKLVHGNTIHGRQDRTHPKTALTYYHPTGPIGTHFKTFASEYANSNIALVGLGVGSLATYGTPGMRMNFFEIDPVVLKIAQDRKYFTFLNDSEATLRFILGDARLTLSKEPEKSFDFLVLDAFSSDAIPMHLLTVQAMQMYRTKLKPGSFIALHISNRYLELAPLINQVAKVAGLHAVSMEDGASEEEKEAGKAASHWMMLCDDKQKLKALMKREPGWTDVSEEGRQPRPWTDDYSNLMSCLKSQGAGLFSPE